MNSMACYSIENSPSDVVAETARSVMPKRLPLNITQESRP